MIASAAIETANINLRTWALCILWRLRGSVTGAHSIRMQVRMEHHWFSAQEQGPLAGNILHAGAGFELRSASHTWYPGRRFPLSHHECRRNVTACQRNSRG